MQFSGETNGLDLYTDCRFLCGLETGDGGATPDTTSYPIKMFTRNSNLAMDKVTPLIMKSDNAWEWDDTNQTDLPIAVHDLTANQQDYTITVSYLKIMRVRIKDQSGTWVTLTPINRKSISDSLMNQTAGDPKGYDKLGLSLFLYPTPNYTSSGGLEVQYQRPASYFTYTDTTKTPGFASQFHRLISMMAALEYCKINGMKERAAGLMADIGSPPDVMNGEPGSGMLKELVDFYSQRDGDTKPNLRPLAEDYGQRALDPGMGAFPVTNNPRGF